MSATAFLEILLPTLSIETIPEMSLDEVLSFFELNLSSQQMRQIRALSDIYDVENLRSYLLGQPMHALGNLPRHRLTEKTLDNECSIPGTEKFFELYPDMEMKKKHAHLLMLSFLKSRSRAARSFVQENYLFELRLRHIFAYLRAQDLEKNYEIEDDELSFSLSDLNTWPLEFLDLPRLWKGAQRGPLEFEYSIAKWRFDHYEALGAHNGPFSFKNILLYFLKLRLLEARKNMRNPQLAHTLNRIARAVQ